MTRKQVNVIKLLYNFVMALIVLLIVGIVLDLVLKAIPAEGSFALGIKLAELAAPGVEDVAKLLLDVLYAFIYAILKSK